MRGVSSNGRGCIRIGAFTTTDLPSVAVKTIMAMPSKGPHIMQGKDGRFVFSQPGKCKVTEKSTMNAVEVKNVGLEVSLRSPNLEGAEAVNII